MKQGNTQVPTEIRSGRGRLVLSLALWLAIYSMLILLYHQAFYYTSPILVRWLQVAPSAFLLETVSPGLEVTRLPTALATASLELQILKGCDGTESWLMLLSALVVFPAPAKRRLLGVLWGTILVFGLNQLRIVSLFLVALHRPDWFDMAHGTIWQTVMVAAGAVFVLVWMRPERLAPAETSGGA
jgi:exosortase family protein XrtM